MRGAAAAGAGLPRLPATSSVSYTKGDINTSTISNASRFIRRFCPGNRPAGRAGRAPRGAAVGSGGGRSRDGRGPRTPSGTRQPAVSSFSSVTCGAGA